MVLELKLRKVGNSVGVVFPKEALSYLKVGDGDVLCVTEAPEGSLRISPAKGGDFNWGGVRNVAIRSGDGRGRAGLVTDANNATGYHHDLLIKGFDVGIEIAAGRETMVTLEYATLFSTATTSNSLIQSSHLAVYFYRPRCCSSTRSSSAGPFQSTLKKVLTVGIEVPYSTMVQRNREGCDSSEGGLGRMCSVQFKIIGSK